MGACKLAKWYAKRPPALLLPKNKSESCEREEACQQHTSKASHSRLLLAICGPKERGYKKKDFLFAEVDSEDLC